MSEKRKYTLGEEILTLYRTVWALACLLPEQQ